MLTGTRESLTEGAIDHAKDSVKSILRFTYYVPIYNVPVRTGVVLSRLWQHRVIRRPLQATYTLTTNQLLLHIHNTTGTGIYLYLKIVAREYNIILTGRPTCVEGRF